MKLAALCCTYLRPKHLGHLIECFRRQDYPPELRELVILDDAGQYRNQEGDGWRLVSIPRRFQTLGEKRNACAGLASSDVEGFLVTDDDDIYLPHWFRTQASALQHGQWSRPSRVLLEHGDVLKEAETGGLYHSGWGYHRSVFAEMRGYRHMNTGEDLELAARMEHAGIRQFDPCQLAPPFLHYRVHSGCYHISYMGQDAYSELGNWSVEPVGNLAIEWPRDYTQVHVIRRHAYGPSQEPVDGGLPVELIRPYEGYGRNGPQNGMSALQQELKRRIADGLHWLTIKQLPASRGALPWFWHWADRSYAGWWDSEGHPFVQGPNMLFTLSGSPRIDGEECVLLDAPNCRAMFCHTEWYRKLIRSQRGRTNQSPIVTWPYPVDPWPDGPVVDEYDLLIYCKSGNRPNLEETLQQLFPRHVRFEYGSFAREELYEAARRSRACAYLCDDESGGIAVQEILLAGCPTVGVGTGSPLVQNGLTGYVVDRLPPGRGAITSTWDEIALQFYLNAIDMAQQLNRQFVRECAAVQFSTSAIVDTILSALDSARRIRP